MCRCAHWKLIPSAPSPFGSQDCSSQISYNPIWRVEESLWGNPWNQERGPTRAWWFLYCSVPSWWASGEISLKPLLCLYWTAEEHYLRNTVNFVMKGLSFFALPLGNWTPNFLPNSNSYVWYSGIYFWALNLFQTLLCLFILISPWFPSADPLTQEFNKHGWTEYILCAR